jgi:hypothetical protein
MLHLLVWWVKCRFCTIVGFIFSLCLNFFYLLARKPNLENFLFIQANSFIIFTCPNPVLLVPGSIFQGFKIPYDTRFRQSGLVRKLYLHDICKVVSSKIFCSWHSYILFEVLLVSTWLGWFSFRYVPADTSVQFKRILI